MDYQWSKYLSNKLGKPVTSIKSVHGGDISDAFCIFSQSDQFFLKVNTRSFLSNFQSEGNSLLFLRAKSSLKVPNVLHSGVYQEHAFLVLEFIKSSQPNSVFWQNLGVGLAELHQNHSSEFGHFEDNFIGSLNQKNTDSLSWQSFYDTSRLSPLFKIGFDLGMFNNEDSRNLQTLIKHIPSICPNEAASLIHGDLWSGNMLCSNNSAYLIDPSISYAHREMDIAMTKLFGGFDALFYGAYQDTFPLEADFESRKEIYQLYYLLVHAILFHGGYIQTVKNILGKF